MAKGWVSKKLKSRRSCAKGSFRYKSLSARRRLLICCPKGKWSPRAETCRVGTRAYELQTRR